MAEITGEVDFENLKSTYTNKLKSAMNRGNLRDIQSNSFNLLDCIVGTQDLDLLYSFNDAYLLLKKHLSKDDLSSFLEKSIDFIFENYECNFFSEDLYHAKYIYQLRSMFKDYMQLN